MVSASAAPHAVAAAATAVATAAPAAAPADAPAAPADLLIRPYDHSTDYDEICRICKTVCECSAVGLGAGGRRRGPLFTEAAASAAAITAAHAAGSGWQRRVQRHMRLGRKTCCIGRRGGEQGQRAGGGGRAGLLTFSPGVPSQATKAVTQIVRPTLTADGGSDYLPRVIGERAARADTIVLCSEAGAEAAADEEPGEAAEEGGARSSGDGGGAWAGSEQRPRRLSGVGEQAAQRAGRVLCAGGATRCI